MFLKKNVSEQPLSQSYDIVISIFCNNNIKFVTCTSVVEPNSDFLSFLCCVALLVHGTDMPEQRHYRRKNLSKILLSECHSNCYYYLLLLLYHVCLMKVNSVLSLFGDLSLNLVVV